MNNISILQKCLVELETDHPRLDYLRGMLVTLVDVQRQDNKPDPYVAKAVYPKGSVGESLNPPVQDEAALLDARAKAALETIKAMENTTE